MCMLPFLYLQVTTSKMQTHLHQHRYLNLYVFLLHPTYSINCSPIPTHKHEIVDGIKVKRLFQCHHPGQLAWLANQKQLLPSTGPLGGHCSEGTFTGPS
jgi:hypothetical protein